MRAASARFHEGRRRRRASRGRSPLFCPRPRFERCDRVRPRRRAFGGSEAGGEADRSLVKRAGPRVRGKVRRAPEPRLKEGRRPPMRDRPCGCGRLREGAGVLLKDGARRISFGGSGWSGRAGIEPGFAQQSAPGDRAAVVRRSEGAFEALELFRHDRERGGEGRRQGGARRHFLIGVRREGNQQADADQPGGGHADRPVQTRHTHKQPAERFHGSRRDPRGGPEKSTRAYGYRLLGLRAGYRGNVSRVPFLF